MSTSQPRLRVIVAKLGLDGHDRGAKVVVRALRDAGMEVLYTGIRARPEHVAAIVRDEDLAVVCVSVLSGAHLELWRRLRAALAEVGMAATPVVIGGIVPAEDEAVLRAEGVTAVFGPGAGLPEIVDAVRRIALHTAAR